MPAGTQMRFVTLFFKAALSPVLSLFLAAPESVAAGLTVYGGVNAPYIWTQTPAGVTSWQAFDKILSEANVVITPGSGFGSKGEGYFRISAFNTRANAEEVARRLQALAW